MSEPAGVSPRPRPFHEYETRVERIDELTPRVRGVRLRLPPGKRMIFQAGQFVQIFVPRGDDVRRTSYSIASSPTNGHSLELCVTRVEKGASSHFLHGLKTGDRVRALGPLGRFVLPPAPPRDLVFVATGSGIAPFRSMIRFLFDKGTRRNVYLVFGNRFEEDIIYRSEWEALARERPDFHPRLTLSRPGSAWSGAHGYVQDQIARFVPEPKEKDFYICGLREMIDAAADKLTGLGVPAGRIHFERYD